MIFSMSLLVSRETRKGCRVSRPSWVPQCTLPDPSLDSQIVPHRVPSRERSPLVTGPSLPGVPVSCRPGTLRTLRLHPLYLDRPKTRRVMDGPGGWESVTVLLDESGVSLGDTFTLEVVWTRGFPQRGPRGRSGWRVSDSCLGPYGVSWWTRVCRGSVRGVGTA